MKRVENIISMLFLFIIAGVVSIIFYERHYASKYKRTEIPISFEKFKENWGEPDRIIQYSGGYKTVFYYTMLNEFVFNLDENEIVKSRYKDNF